MIDKCLTLIRRRLNEYLQGIYLQSDNMVVLSSLTDSDRKPAVRTRNRIAMLLINASQDTAPRHRRAALPAEVGLAPPIHLDIFSCWPPHMSRICMLKVSSRSRRR